LFPKPSATTESESKNVPLKSTLCGTISLGKTQSNFQGVIPAVSLMLGTKIEVNFGNKKFKFAVPPEHKSVHDWFLEKRQT